MRQITISHDDASLLLGACDEAREQRLYDADQAESHDDDPEQAEVDRYMAAEFERLCKVLTKLLYG